MLNQTGSRITAPLTHHLRVALMDEPHSTTLRGQTWRQGKNALQNLKIGILKPSTKIISGESSIIDKKQVVPIRMIKNERYACILYACHIGVDTNCSSPFGNKITGIQDKMCLKANRVRWPASLARALHSTLFTL